jgi:hypothetical protein
VADLAIISLFTPDDLTKHLQDEAVKKKSKMFKVFLDYSSESKARKLLWASSSIT